MNEYEIAIAQLRSDISAGKVSAEAGKAKYAELRAKKADMDKRSAMKGAPLETRSVSYADIAAAMKEKRAVTLNGTGAVNQVNELFKVLQAKTPILEKVRYFKGANASTNIPVWNPTIATPGNYAEGATSVAADSTGALGSQSLTPYAYISLLPVSAEALQLGIVDIESELDSIFGDAFAQAFHNAILTGDGTGRNMTGIFGAIPTGNKVTAAATGNPKVADLVKLALNMKDKSDSAVIIMNPTIYSGIMADATTGVADLYKEELIRSKTIEGVQVILTSGAPSAVTAGSVVAAACDLSQYAFAMATEITIEPKKKVGDSNTYFEATVFANGKPIVPANFYGLVTV